MRTTVPDEQIKQAVDAVAVYGSQRKAAKALGVARSTFQNWVNLGKMRGYSPEHDMTKLSPEGFLIKGTSTLYDEDGNIKVQWVKTTKDAEQQQIAMQASIEAMCKDIKPIKPAKKPKQTYAKLCNEYIITDFHYGALCWHKEGGADWDVKIAGDVLWKCFKAMIDGSPKASKCVIAQLGDFFHSDSLEPKTPASGHILDQDGRISKIVEEATTVFRRIVDYALQVHDEVHVIIAEGNHDEYTSMLTRVMFKALYRDEKRITINDSKLPYYVYQHGSIMLSYHHGHKKKMGSLPLFFAAQYPIMWGATTYRYCATGHYHHSERHKGQGKEYSGMDVEQYQTIAARDAYASRGGWLSQRSVTSNTYHETNGKAGSKIITPEMLED